MYSLSNANMEATKLNHFIIIVDIPQCVPLCLLHQKGLASVYTSVDSHFSSGSPHCLVDNLKLESYDSIAIASNDLNQIFVVCDPASRNVLGCFIPFGDCPVVYSYI